MKVEQIRTSSESNKSAAYLSRAMELSAKASELQGGFIVGKIKQEVHRACELTKGADCEYTAYAHAHACEQWAAQIGIA